MRNLLLGALAALALTLALPASAAPASAPDFDAETFLGMTVEEVSAALGALGYVVRSGELDDGMIEVYIVGRGIMAKVVVDPQDGRPVEINIRS